MRFKVCENARKNVEDIKTGEAFLCYNEEEAEKLCNYLNKEITGTSKSIYEMTAFDLIRNKDQLIMDYNQFMIKYRELEAKLLIDTDFSEALGKSRTNKEEREAYINREMAKVIAVRKSYEHSIDIVNDLLRLRMKEVTNGWNL